MACSLVLWGYYLSCEAIYTKGVSCGTRVGLAHCFGCVAFHMHLYVELRFGLDAVYFGLITPVVICTLECVGVTVTVKTATARRSPTECVGVMEYVVVR